MHSVNLIKHHSQAKTQGSRAYLLYLLYSIFHKILGLQNNLLTNLMHCHATVYK